MTNYNINVYTYIHNFKDLLLEIIRQNIMAILVLMQNGLFVYDIKKFLKSESFLHGEINEYNQSKA